MAQEAGYPVGPASRHPNDILLYRAFSQLPPALAGSTAYSAPSSAVTSPSASRHHSRSTSVQPINGGDGGLTPYEHSSACSSEDLASLHVGLQMPTVSSVGSHNPLIHAQRTGQSPVATPKVFSNRDGQRSALDVAMTPIAEEARGTTTNRAQKKKNAGMRIDVPPSSNGTTKKETNPQKDGSIDLGAYSDLALTNIAFAESIERSATLRGAAFEVHQAIYDGRFNSFLQSQRRQIQAQTAGSTLPSLPMGKQAIDEAELAYVTLKHYDGNAIFENPFVLVQTPDLIASQFKALLKVAQRVGSELLDVTECEGYGGTHLIVLDQIMRLEVPLGPNWIWQWRQEASKADTIVASERSWHDYRPSRIAKRFLARRGLWNSNTEKDELLPMTHHKAESRSSSKANDEMHSEEPPTETRPSQGYFGAASASYAGQPSIAPNSFASGYPFETPRATPGQSPWHTPGRRNSLRGPFDSIESHLHRAGSFTPIRGPQTPGGESDGGSTILSTALAGPSTSVGPGIRFRSTSIDFPRELDFASSSNHDAVSTMIAKPLGAPMIQFKIRLLTRMTFNEQGKICHHEDVWGVRDMIEGMVPIAGWLYTYLGRKANGWLVGRLVGWPGHAGDK